MKLRKNNDSSTIEISISNQTIVRTLGILLAGIVLVMAVRISADTLVLIGTGLFLALALNSPVRWLASRLPGKKRGNRKLATIISVVIIMLTLAVLLWAIVPSVVKQSVSFISSIPQLIADMQDQSTAVGGFIRHYNLENQVDKITTQLTNSVGDISGSAVSALSTIGSSIFAVVTVIVLTIMILLEGPSWVDKAYQIMPTSRRAHTKKLASSMLKIIQGYVNGQVTLAAIAAVLIVPVFFIMHVNYPIVLMAIVFICGLIPMVGHTIGAVICTVIALFTSLPAALIVLGYYILYQQIENYAVQPKVQANSTNMSPLLVFIAVLLGASFGGLLGALVAIPIMGCIRILVIDFLERRNILTPAQASATVTLDDTQGHTKKN